jgi:hypothetical protein
MKSVLASCLQWLTGTFSKRRCDECPDNRFQRQIGTSSALAGIDELLEGKGGGQTIYVPCCETERLSELVALLGELLNRKPRSRMSRLEQDRWPAIKPIHARRAICWVST